MILLNTRFCKIGQLWFTDISKDMESLPKTVDIIEFIQCPLPVTGAQEASDFLTLTIDLHQSSEAIYAKISKNAQYKIRRAIRDEVTYQAWDTPDANTLKEFCDFYDEFALQKSRGKIGRSLLIAYAEAGVLHLSCVRAPDQDVLTWHAHIFSKNRARLLQSASLFRESNSERQALIGRANRFHHWQDILHFKSRVGDVYDLGGWYGGNTDESKLRINQFKEEFGGSQLKEYTGMKAISFSGKLYLQLKRLRERLRG